MKPQPQTSPQEVLAGLIERVTYHNAENGFCVLRAKARGHRDVVTVVGHAAAIAAGEWITASGEWVNDRTHGQQFKARFLRNVAPDLGDGIEKYLSSGMIRGVGPVYARKLVRAFGEKVFDVIEATPDRLREVDGIGPVRAATARVIAVHVSVHEEPQRSRMICLIAATILSVTCGNCASTNSTPRARRARPRPPWPSMP